MNICRKEENINIRDFAEMGMRGRRLNSRSQRGSERILIPAVDENIIFKKVFNQKQNNTPLFWCLIFQPTLMTSLPPASIEMICG